MKKCLIWTMAGLFLGALVLGTPEITKAQDGGKIYTDKCVLCHGPKGDGKGRLASSFDPKPGDFCDPKFWQGDPDKKIHDSITKGKGQMKPVDLKPAEIKAVADYMKATCRK